MDFGSVLTALIIISVLGILVGAFLGLAGIVFSVKTNPKEEEVLKALPGNNCGGCGYPGCAGLAKAIVANEAPVNQCPVGGDEVASEIAMIMGTEKVETEKKVAFVACKAHCSDVTYDYEYYGVEDCRMLSFVPNGGPKSCNNGCLGFGSCAKICPFDAIHVVNGIAVVDKDMVGQEIQGVPIIANGENITEVLTQSAIDRVFISTPHIIFSSSI